MKFRIAFVASTALALAACGSAEDASTEAEADTVEIPANDALDGVDETAVADDAATEEQAETGEPGEVEQARIEEAGDDAAAAAADVADALGEDVQATAGEAVEAVEEAAQNATGQ